MKIYIDLFFLFNIIMDAIIITSTSILLKRKTTIFRIVLSSLVGGISSLFLFTKIDKLLIEIFSVMAMNILAFRYMNLRYLLKNIFYTYLLSVLLGGIIYLFNIKVTSNVFITYLIIIIISIEVMILYVKEMKKMKNNYNNYCKVDIYFKDGDKASFIGFFDTGNNLYDQYKKRPIILVSKKYERDGNFILVPYYTAMGEGLLKCISIESIYIENVGYKRNVLVAFSDSPNFVDGVDVILHKDLMKG